MEYRKRQRRVQKRRVRQDSYAGTVFCVVLLFAAIVYLIGISSAGTWMAKTVVAPVFRTLGIVSDTESPAETQSAATLKALVTESVRIPSKACYALQMGVYSNSDNAAKQSSALQAVGAAGYVCSDDEKYRVLASCYPTEEDIRAVRTRLSEEGMESSIHQFKDAETEWLITAEQEQIDVFQEAVTALMSIGDRIYSVIYTFDSEKQTVPMGKAAITILCSETETHLAALESIQAQNHMIERLAACYRSILNMLQETASLDTEETVSFSARLKYLHLYVEDTVCRFMNEAE